MQNMQEFLVSVYPNLSSIGSSLSLKGKLPESSYEYAGMTLSLPSGISYDLTLTNTGEAIIAMGHICAHIVGECARCLSTAELDIEGELQAYYLRSGASSSGASNGAVNNGASSGVAGSNAGKNGAANNGIANSGAANNGAINSGAANHTKNQNDADSIEEIAAEEVVGYVDKDGNIDLSDACLAALVYATPYVIVCKDDCKGLCPKCGVNLNEDPTHNHDDEIDPSNPFAFLKDYKFRD